MRQFACNRTSCAAVAAGCADSVIRELGPETTKRGDRHCRFLRIHREQPGKRERQARVRLDEQRAAGPVQSRVVPSAWLWTGDNPRCGRCRRRLDYPRLPARHRKPRRRARPLDGDAHLYGSVRPRPVLTGAPARPARPAGGSWRRQSTIRARRGLSPRRMPAKSTRLRPQGPCETRDVRNRAHRAPCRGAPVRTER